MPHTLVAETASICSGRVVCPAGSSLAGSGTTRHLFPLKCSDTQPPRAPSYAHAQMFDLEAALTNRAVPPPPSVTASGVRRHAVPL